jgi:hypothetical protein
MILVNADGCYCGQEGRADLCDINALPHGARAIVSYLVGVLATDAGGWRLGCCYGFGEEAVRCWFWSEVQVGAEFWYGLQCIWTRAVPRRVWWPFS